MATPRLNPLEHLHLPHRERPLLSWHYDLDAVIAACCCALLVGMMLALPFKVRDEAQGVEFRPWGMSDPSALGSRQELAIQNKELEAKYKELQKELAQERNLKQGLEARLAEKEQVATEVLTDLNRARLLAGLLPAEGPGLILHLSENLEGAITSEDVGLRMIHQEDLLNIVNELWASGAEAMAIRSSAGTERLVASSYIRCQGPVVNVNSQKMGPPFEILAIGEAGTMRQSLEFPTGVLAVLSIYKVNWSIEESDMLVLPAFTGKTFPDYARVHQENVETAGDAARGTEEGD